MKIMKIEKLVKLSKTIGRIGIALGTINLCFVTLFFVIVLIEKINLTPSQIYCYVCSYTCSIVSIIIGKISISKLKMLEKELHITPLGREGSGKVRFVEENKEEK